MGEECSIAQGRNPGGIGSVFSSRGSSGEGFTSKLPLVVDNSLLVAVESVAICFFKAGSGREFPLCVKSLASGKAWTS